jgi:hypothetical protein
MADAGDFVYVDFASRALPGFRNHVVQVGDLGQLAQRYGRSDCFCTYFLFDNGLQEYVRDNHASVAGYQGPCAANYLPMDIDSPDVGQALETARGVTRYLLDRLGVPEEGVAVYYSGMKGFHVNVASTALGNGGPATDLPAVYREMRRAIVQEARPAYPEAVDHSISDRLRLLRMPNTRHSKSGLYKVPLHIEELMNYKPHEIKHLAQKPRDPWLTDESGLVPRHWVAPVVDAVELYERCTEEAERRVHSGLPDPGTFLGNDDIGKALCRAELELYREGVGEGARSSVCLRLASRFRSAGYSHDEAQRMVESFAARCSPPMEPQSARRIVEVAYRANGRGYQFGCGTGNGDPSHTSLVREKCPYTKRKDCGTFRRFGSSLNNGGHPHS